MIVTGMVLLAIGGADLARQFLSRRALRIVVAVAAVAVIAFGALSAAPLAGLLAVALAIAWVWVFPSGARARAGFWPAVALAIVCTVFVAVLGPRDNAGLLGDVWNVPTPWGPLPLDNTILVIGAVAILLESGNVIVRSALASEMPEPDRVEVPPHTLKGGRLIGPLERVIVFALTLTGVYSLLAAVLAAKGIVRFPEISRDRDEGNRAEYFLIGSLVSWVIALAAAFLVWWGLSGIV